MVELDPSNKVFGEVDEFFQELNLEDYRDQVDISKMAAVIRTQERLLNWPEFDAHLMEQIESYQQQGLISVITKEEVVKIEYDETTRNRDFKVAMKSGREITTSHLINATWANIEMLDETLFPEAATEERTNRMKLIASITLPEHARDAASMFTAMGPYAMFSNEGNGKGKITYAPVTNMLDYVIEEFKKTDESTYDFELRALWQEWLDADEIILGNVILEDKITSETEMILEEINDEVTLNNLREINAKEAAEKKWELLRNIECKVTIPPLYKRWLVEGLNQKEQAFFGRKLLEGVLESYPVLAGAEVIKVDGGIVKSNSEVNIRKTDSQFHQRSDHGLKQRQIGYSDFNGVKLFYCESQSRCTVENIITDIRLNNLIKKEVASSATDEQRESMLNSFVRRYASEKTLNRGDFSQLKLRADTIIANQASVSFFEEFLGSMFNLYLNQPKLTLNCTTPFLGKIFQSIGDAAKVIIKSNEFDIFNEGKVEEQQRKIDHSLIAKYPKLFTIFSIIDSEGNIIVDSKYGVVSNKMREEHQIPSLKNRDYVQKMMHSNKQEFICGEPVIGSTSHEFMIPIGIRMNHDYYLTFGMSVAGLMSTIGLNHTRSESRH
ncbi:MAG: hypothetical protein V4694_04710 [Pseudomonadota bacterium]